MSQSDYDQKSPALKPKAKAFQKHFAELADSITDPDRLASKLYAKGFIDRTTREDITTTTGVSSYTRTMKLLNAVEGRIRTDRFAFRKLTRVLCSIQSTKPVGEALMASYSEYSDTTRGSHLRVAFRSVFFTSRKFPQMGRIGRKLI